MRRRNDTPTGPDVNLAAAGIGSTENPGSPATASAEQLRARQPAMPAAALARYADFGPGDQLGITIGAELYSPVKYNTFEIGPFSATVVVRPGETGADAAARCYRVLLELNEAEFQIAWGRHRERLRATGGEKR